MQIIVFIPVPGYLTAFGRPSGHREVAPREFDVHSRWKPAREQKKNIRRIGRIRRIRRVKRIRRIRRIIRRIRRRRE